MQNIFSRCRKQQPTSTWRKLTAWTETPLASSHVWCFPSSQTEWRDLGQFLSSLGSLCSPLRFTPTGPLIGHTAPTLASHWSRLASLEMLVFGTLLIKLGSGECNRSRAPCFETFPFQPIRGLSCAPWPIRGRSCSPPLGIPCLQACHSVCLILRWY